MTTDAYQTLAVAAERIRELLLPGRRDENGDYADEELIRVDAYIAFCHAEFENYLEQIAIRLLYWTEQAARQGGFDRSGAALITYYRPGRDKIPSSSKVPSDDVISTLAVRCAKEHLSAVGGNNGIKEDSLCSLFLPLGIDFRQLDSLLTSELEAFGAARGKLAHLSYGDHRRREINDPAVALAKVETLLALLEAFDAEVERQFPNKLAIPPSEPAADADEDTLEPAEA